MDFFSRMRRKIVHLGRRRIVRYLTRVEPEELQRKSERMAIDAFRYASKRVPAYRKLLADMGIDPSSVRDIDTFRRRVPFIDKEMTFIRYRTEVSQLCVDGSLRGVQSLITSSGHSGRFSYGVITRKEAKKTPLLLDFLMDYNLFISRYRTLLINVLPMGVKAPSEECVTADVSVRSDMAIAIVRGFHRQFDQILLLGENSFVKKVVEEGKEEGIDWSSIRTNIAVGEEVMPESYRSYMAHLLSHDLDDPTGPIIASTMGVSELGLSIFQENRGTIPIRRLAVEDRRLRYAIFGEGRDVCPALFQYFPTFLYVEEAEGERGYPYGERELAVTMLGKDARIPLVRYRTGDTGRIIPYRRMEEILTDLGYREYCPPLKLPFVYVSGRGKSIRKGDVEVFPEDIKEGIYSDFEVARSTTANFRMLPEGEEILLHVQLKRGIPTSPELKEKYRKAIAKYVKVPLRIELFPLDAFPYPLDYERKFRYI